jgi:hypothetical protein
MLDAAASMSRIALAWKSRSEPSPVTGDKRYRYAIYSPALESNPGISGTGRLAGETEMSNSKTVFIAFAKEDETTRNLFTGQRVNSSTPFEFIDMSVKEPYVTEWKQRVRTRIRRSDGVVALISSSTPKATGELWEITCAVEEKKPLLGIWVEDRYKVKPSVMGSAPCTKWTWPNVASFIEGL